MLVDEDGEAHILELLPPAADSEVAKVASECSVPLPTELREALMVSAGFANGPLESVGFLDLAGFGMFGDVVETLLDNAVQVPGDVFWGFCITFYL